MNMEYLFAALVFTSLIGAVSAVVLRKSKYCAPVAFGVAALAALLGALLAASVLLGTGFQLAIPAHYQFGNMSFTALSFTLDRLSAFFVLAISVVGFAVAVYSIGYVREYEGKYSIGLLGAIFNLFLLSMILVVTAGNAVLFLVVWEVMSLLSYLLVVYENRKKEAVSAGFLYIVMTHVGTAFIMLGFLLLAATTGSFDFASYQGAGASMPALLKSLAFVLFLIGFGTKAGIVPLHIWLPYAHPAAPSNISALMSGVMVKTAIYMLIRTAFEFLGVTDTWWGLLVLLVASISAVLGVLYALNEKDLKRLLAFSTVENIGIILIALGASMVFLSYGLKDFAALALIAALFHAFNHSLFKALLFMGAGAVIHSVHTKNIELMGGLAKRMPWTGALFFVGALAISAIPPLNGFVSEWLIFQSLLLSSNIPEMVVKILLPVTVGMLALTGALAAACFVRAYGIVFLAAPRSEHAAEAKEVPLTMLAGMGILAVLCVLTGLLSVFLVPVIDGVTTPVIGVSVASQIASGFVIVVKTAGATFSSVSPLVIAALLIVLLPVLYIITRYYGGQRKIVTGDTWDCGTPLSPRNEYTGTAYSKSINMIFSGIYRPSKELVAKPTASPYIRKDMTYSDRTEQLFEKYLYSPVAGFAVRAARRLSFIQTGSIQAYLAYIFITLVLLLIIFR